MSWYEHGVSGVWWLEVRVAESPLLPTGSAGMLRGYGAWVDVVTYADTRTVVYTLDVS